MGDENAATALTAEQRRVGVEESFASLRLAGLHPTRAALNDAEDYVEGRRTLDEIIADAVSRHTARGRLRPAESDRVDPARRTASLPGAVHVPVLALRFVDVEHQRLLTVGCLEPPPEERGPPFQRRGPD